MIHSKVVYPQFTYIGERRSTTKIDMAAHTASSETHSLPQSELEPHHDIGANYEIPAPEAFISFGALKDRIRRHYELCSDYYYSLW